MWVKWHKPRLSITTYNTVLKLCDWTICVNFTANTSSPHAPQCTLCTNFLHISLGTGSIKSSSLPHLKLQKHISSWCKDQQCSSRWKYITNSTTEVAATLVWYQSYTCWHVALTNWGGQTCIRCISWIKKHLHSLFVISLANMIHLILIVFFTLAFQNDLLNME